MTKPRKAKYYLKENWYNCWWGILQTTNNVCIAMVENHQMALLLLEILNDLPRSAVYIVTSGNAKERWKKREQERVRQIKEDVEREGEKVMRNKFKRGK